MPPNIQNSLGWLNLQLRANQLQQQQQQAVQQQAFDREAKQQDIQNALGFARHEMAAQDASETRKLQLAAMLQRAREAEQGKSTRQEDKQAFEQPKIDAMVKKALADAGYAEARTKEVAPNAQSERQYRSNSIATQRRGQTLSLLGGMLRAGATADPYGRRTIMPGQETVDYAASVIDEPLPVEDSSPPEVPQEVPQLRPPEMPGAPLPDLTNAQMDAAKAAARATMAAPPPPPRTSKRVATVAPPRDPNLQPLKPTDLAEHAEKAKASADRVGRLNELYKQAEGMADSSFGLTGGLLGLNTVKDIGAAGQSKLQQWGLISSDPTELQKESSDRAVFESGAGRDMAQTIKDFSGLVASDREAARIAKQTGQDAAIFNAVAKTGDISPFVKDKKIFLAVLGAAIKYEEEKGAKEVTVIRDQGIRLPDFSGGAATSTSGDTSSVNSDVARIRQYQAEHGVSEEEAMDALGL